MPDGSSPISDDRARTTLERLLARDPMFPGIGPARARALAEAFGEGLHAALADQDTRVLDIIGNDLVVADLFANYQLKLSEMDLCAWLDERGIEPWIGAKIVRGWGARGAALVKRNPYLLVAFTSWNVAERVARSMRIEKDDPRRLIGAVEAGLYQRLEQGHTWTSTSDVIKSATQKLGNATLARQAPRLTVFDQGATAYDSGLQPVGTHLMERQCASILTTAMVEAQQYDLVAREITVPEIDEAIAEFEAAQDFPLTERQRDAVRMALTVKVGLIGGFAGSGKTSVLKAVCDIADRFGRVLHLMALSGKAAKRISEATGRPASTIAAFLRRIEDKGLSMGPEAIVCVDESSMVDTRTLWRILKRLGGGRLLLVGDPAQLGPIGPGSPFHTMIDSPLVPKVVLDRVLRQTEASGIPLVAQAIRNGEIPALRNFDCLGNGVSFVDCKIEDAVQTIHQIGTNLRRQGAERGTVQIISPIHRGPAGTERINHYFHSLRPNPTLSPWRDIAVGDPVQWLQNDHQRDIQNGSTGRFLGFEDSGAPIVELDGRALTMTRADGRYLALAYALSVHKSQGSQWNRVIVPVFRSPILDRTLLYTAVTRAADQVILLGDRAAFNQAVQAKAAVQRRDTRLAEHLEDAQLLAA